MRARAAVVVVVFALLGAARCSLLVKTDDLVSGNGGNGGNGGDPDGGGGAPDRAPPNPCGADLANNPMNCGACGRSCLGGVCMSSRCLPVTLATDQKKPLGIGVHGDFVFWVNQSPPQLWAARKDGSDPRRLDIQADALQDPFDIASDGQFVYWTEVLSNNVFKKTFPVGGTKMSVMAGPGTVAFLVVDGSQVYASDYKTTPPLGGAIIDRTVLFNEPDTVAGLAVQAGVMFWARQSRSEIMSGSTAGAGAGMPTLFARVRGRAMGVAADRDYVYWIEDGQRVKRASRRGAGTADTLYEAGQPFGDSDITVDDIALYWTENGLPGPDGFVRRMAK